MSSATMRASVGVQTSEVFWMHWTQFGLPLLSSGVLPASCVHGPPAGGAMLVQTPAWQTSVSVAGEGAGQTFPQEPQLLTSVWTLMHVPASLQLTVGAAQTKAPFSQLMKADIVVYVWPLHRPLSGRATVAVTLTCGTKAAPWAQANVVVEEVGLPKVPPPAGVSVQLTIELGPI